jgi:hypothetical protein
MESAHSPIAGAWLAKTKGILAGKDTFVALWRLMSIFFIESYRRIGSVSSGLHPRDQQRSVVTSAFLGWSPQRSILPSGSLVEPSADSSFA